MITVQILVTAVLLSVGALVLGYTQVAKGFALGSLFSLINFRIMAFHAPRRLGKSRGRAGWDGYLSLLIRIVLLAVPLLMALRLEQFSLIWTVLGVLNLQFSILIYGLVSGQTVTSYRNTSPEALTTMDEITSVPQWILSVGGAQFVLNSATLINSWIVMAILIIFGFLASRQTKIIPNPLQSVAELIVSTFDNLIKDALEMDNYRRYFPLITGLFLYIWLCNILGVVPYLSEPTKDLNTPLSLGLIGFVVSPLRRHQGQGHQGLHPSVFSAAFF